MANLNLHELAKDALDDIMAYGSAMILRRVTLTDEYDPETGTMKEVVEDSPIHGFKTSPSLKEFGESAVQVGDVTVLVSAAELVATPATNARLATAPATSDRLVMNGEEWGIMDIHTVKPGDIPVLYKILARRA